MWVKGHSGVEERTTRQPMEGPRWPSQSIREIDDARAQPSHTGRVIRQILQITTNAALQHMKKTGTEKQSGV